MLVLRRKPGETIRIFVEPSLTTQAIEVIVCEVLGKSASIGVEASDKVKILRGEVVDREQPA